MKNTSFAPAYVAIYPFLAAIARECGYSLSIHGSVGATLSSDLDLIATPWINECKSPQELISKISEKIVTAFNQDVVDSMNGLEPEKKPHGRLAYRIPCRNGAAIDISIVQPSCDIESMPTELTAENGAEELLIGEFFEEIHFDCCDCNATGVSYHHLQGIDAQSGEKCEKCNGTGQVSEIVYIELETIKAIYRKIVEFYTK